MPLCVVDLRETAVGAARVKFFQTLQKIRKREMWEDFDTGGGVFSVSHSCAGPGRRLQLVFCLKTCCQRRCVESNLTFESWTLGWHHTRSIETSHWVEFFTFVKLWNSQVDYKISLEPTFKKWCKCVKYQFWVNYPAATSAVFDVISVIQTQTMTSCFLWWVMQCDQSLINTRDKQYPVVMQKLCHFIYLFVFRCKGQSRPHG